jgi:UDP-N-acetylmuramate dehydrogenase
LREILGERVRFDEPLAPYTSWKIGGPADAFAQVGDGGRSSPRSCADVFKRRLPWFVLGSGSNLLVGDGGIRGIVMRLGGEFARSRSRARMRTSSSRAGASAGMPLLTAQAASNGALGIGRSPEFREASAARCA